MRIYELFNIPFISIITNALCIIKMERERLRLYYTSSLIKPLKILENS